MNILLVDDHAMFRESMEMMICGFDERFRIWQAEHGKQALEILNERKIDLTLLDLGLPDIHGIDLLQQIQELQSTPVMILSASESPHDMQRCVDLGARGYVCKTAPANQVRRAIIDVMSGRLHLPEIFHTSTMQLQNEMVTVNNITPRQKEILELLYRGKRNKEIANIMDISEATIKVHIRALFLTLGVNNRHSAVQEGLRLRLLTA